MASQPPPLDLVELLYAETADSNFAQRFYIDPVLFAFELDALQGQWIYAAHVSQIPVDGGLERCLFGESIILTRAADAGIHAFYNVCRHRGSRLLSANAACTGGRLTCPYHGWRYALDGRLATTPSFEQADGGGGTLDLVRVSAYVLEGMVFVAFGGEQPLPTTLIETAVGRLFRFHGLALAKVAAQVRFSVRANWKLAVENFLECYHCLPNHPQLRAVHDHVLVSASTDPADRQSYLGNVIAWSKRARDAKTPLLFNKRIHEDHHQYALGFRLGIRTGSDSMTENGRPVAPLMGEFRAFDGGETFGFVGPFLHFSLGNDHGVIIRVNPAAAEDTVVEVSWLVAADARPGIDFDETRLRWLWENTVRQDCELVERAQQGLHSRGYRPGPYTPLELDLRVFKAWYLRQMRDALACTADQSDAGEEPARCGLRNAE